MNVWREWDVSPQELIHKTKMFIDRSKKRNARLIKLDIKKEYRKFLPLLANEITECCTYHNMCSFIQFVGKTKEMRDAGREADNMMYKHITQIDSNKRLYDAIVRYYLIAKKDKYFTYDDRRFIKKIIKKYIRGGINLTKENTTKLLRIKQEIHKVEKIIMLHIKQDETKMHEFTVNELKGLPVDILCNLPIINNNPIRYGLCIDEGTHNQCMKYIKSSAVRKKIDHIYGTQCKDILRYIVKLFVLRHKFAQVLTYKCYGDYVAANQMARVSSTINDFLSNMIPKLDYRYKREVDVLKNMAGKEVNSWDVQYYITQWKKDYGINEQSVREYFPCNNTLKKILCMCQEMFDLTFTQVQGALTWHPSVAMYSVHENNRLVGYFYLDIYKRKNKSNNIQCFILKHACIYPFNEKQSKYQVPVASLMAGCSSFLSHADVTTFMYEFGHLLHHICGRAKYCILSGINVERDFIKVVPQVMSYLCWDKQILRNISCHYKTKHSLPSHIIEKMEKIRNLNVGVCYKKYIMCAIYDQLLHSSNDILDKGEKLLLSKKTVQQYMEDIYKNLNTEAMAHDPQYKININPGVFMPISWKYILGNMGSRYYGHLWSVVISAEICHKKIVGRDHKKAMLDFKKHIMDKGGTVDAMVLVTNYLGAHPTITGFLKLYYLEKDEEFSFYDKEKYPPRPNYWDTGNDSSSVSTDSDTYCDTDSDVDTDVTNRWKEICDTEATTIDEKSTYIRNKLRNVNDVYIPENTETADDRCRQIFIKKNV